MKYEVTKVLFEVCRVVLTLIIISPLAIPMIGSLVCFIQGWREINHERKSADKKAKKKVSIKKGDIKK